jgi:dipeptidyl aminopeptidase/acylaminoacyl peptidase
MRRWPPLALACALVLAEPAAARRYAIDDQLSLEQLGGAKLAPGGRWGVIQAFAPWERAARYDLDWWSIYGLGRLQRVDLRDGVTRPLLREAPGSGYVAGSFSPSGAKMAVCRLTGHAWELGVVTLASGKVQWLGLSPELPLWGRSLAWRRDDELVVIAQPDQPVGHRLGFGWQAQARLTRSWADAAAGRLAVSAVGSGRNRGLRPKGPPKRLVAVRLSTGQVRTLARGEFIDLEIAPDARTVAVLANGEDLQPSDGPVTTGSPARRRTLTLIDLDSGARTAPCPACDVTSNLLTWSALGDRLLLHARSGSADATSGAFWIIDARSGRSTPAPMGDLTPALTRSPGDGNLASATWVGNFPVVYARPAAGRADWYGLEPAGPRRLTGPMTSPSPRLQATDATSLVVTDGDAVWRVDLQGNARRLAARAADVVRDDGSPESERLTVNAPPTSGRLALRGPTGLTRFERPDQAPLPLAADETPLAFDPATRLAIVSRTDSHGVDRIVLRGPGHPDRSLATLNSGLESVDPADIRPIHHQGPDGQMLTSWLFLPPGLPPGAKPPLVVVPYPGQVFSAPPDGQAPGALRLYANAQVLAGAGYAVLVPSLPFSAKQEPMAGLAQQVLAAVDAAAAQSPVDIGRLAVWGHSYGGYAALALATESSRFKAVIASAALSDLTSNYGALSAYSYAVPEAGLPIFASAGWSETGQARMATPPWKDPERYRRNSPIAFADRITAPVMLIHGDLDGGVGQAQEIFTALYRQNKDAMLVLYRGESHVVLGPANVRDEYARVFQFLGDHIGPGVTPERTSEPKTKPLNGFAS